MIRRIGSDRETFKKLEFSPGLNVLLADKSEGASDRQSRNGAGKTSFVEIVHFLTGGNVKKDSIFRSNVLKDAAFTIQMDVGGNGFTVARSGSAPGKVQVNGPVEGWPIASTFNQDVGVFEISNTNWSHVLGCKWFGLDAPPNPDTKCQPTFRSLFSYFVRRQASGGFNKPTQQATMQQTWDQQVSISYLLGLDWRVSQSFQGLREKEKTVKSLGKAARSGELGPHFEGAADLRTKLAVAAKRAENIRSQLDNFEIIPEYTELEAEASVITGQINGLGEENFVDRRLIDDLELALTEEQAPDRTDLAKLYAEAGVILPDLLKRRLNEVEVFHRTIIENRKSHLSAELTSARNRIDAREAEKLTLDTRRRQIMNVLQSGGALEQYTAMREELGRAEAEVETFRRRLETAEKLESTQAELAIERNRLEQALRDDIHERGDLLSEAIVGFEELSKSLYEQAGSLTIGAGPTGPSFEVRIDGHRSKGITNMQIFCFDLMMTELCARYGRFPGFLIHDSHLFDGVDERQVAKALQLGAERAETAGFQYIVTMNSDVIPGDGLQDSFDINAHVMPTRLTDATENGGLFGIRFSD